MSSTCTNKNDPSSRWTKKHSQFGIFSQPCFNGIFSNCLSHNSPAKWWPYRFLQRGTTGSSMLDHDLGHLCRGRRIQMSGHSDLGFFSKYVNIFHFYLGVSRYCVCCLSFATWQSGDDINDFGGYLRCWRSLLSECCVRARIGFHNITSENDSTFVLLGLCLQSSIFQMTHVHQWCKLNFCARRPCFIDHLFFTSDFREIFSNFSHSSHYVSTAAFAAGIFMAWGMGINLWTKL